jgi:hypothetical protein
MHFTVDDEAAFLERRDALREQFATWLQSHQMAGYPAIADLLMHWKVGYADGALDRWSVADVETFLFDWCLRVLSAPPRACAEIPPSVAAFVEFLADTGLLAPGGDLPAEVRRYCEAETTRFVEEMAAPSRTIAGLPDIDDADGEDDEAPVIGPVRLPSEQERRDAVRAIPVLRQLRALAGYCPPPGRQLTGKGNLRLADARELVTTLETGDDPDFGGRRTLTSAEDLPGLSWLFDLALQAGVVRRSKGRLLAVARFAALGELEAHERVVRAAVVAGLSGPPNPFFPALAQVQTVADECVVGLLADLLDAGADGLPRESLVGTMAELLDAIFLGLPPLVELTMPGWVETQLERLARLGVVTIDGDQVTLTAAGLPVAVALVRDAGTEVLLRPDPPDATPAATADLLGWLDDAEWMDDASAWIAVQPDPETAVDRLMAEVCAERQQPAAVLAGLGLMADLAGDRALAAVRQQLGGPHDGLLVTWLAERSAIQPETIDPVRLFSGLVEILLVALDVEGPQEVVAQFGVGDRRQQLDVLDRIGRLTHPRLPELLEAIDAHHPDKAVAKAARKALGRYRRRTAADPTR